MHSERLSIFGDIQVLENVTAHVQEHIEGISENNKHFDLFVDKNKKNIVNSIIEDLSLKYKFKFQWSKLEHKNWQDNWKKYFTTIEVNNFFTVLPDWKEGEKVNYGEYIFKVIKLKKNRIDQVEIKRKK